MPKSLLIITQRVDETDDLLGFFVAWIGEFSKHFDQVHVITLAAGQYSLPVNVHVHSLGKEHGISKFRQAIHILKLLWKLTSLCDAVFAHMSPIFAIIAWPFVLLRRCKLVLWYLHRSSTFRLRLALALCTNLVTADAASLTVRSPKIISVGHGVDVDHWKVSRNWKLDGRPLRLLLVGRISPIKGIETFIEAVKIIRNRGGTSIEARVVGRPVMSDDVAYAKQLDRTGVEFAGFVPYRDMKAQYAWADIVVGCTPPGGIDKTLLEGMAAGCIVLTSNTVMGPYLDPYVDNLLFTHHDADMLADKILTLRDFAGISQKMVEKVRENFELNTTISRIVQKL